MPRILYGVSPIGLGHASRALVLLGSLKQTGAEVRVFSGGKAAEFLSKMGVDVDDIVDDPVPSISRGEMRRVALWYVRSWLANRRTMRRTEKLLDSYRPDIVVCDEEFSGLTVAERKGIKRVFITDELLLGFARSWIARKVEARVERWYRRLQDSVDLLIVPEFGEDSGNRKFVGPIVRHRSLSCQQVRERHGLPAGRIVLFSASGSEIGLELAHDVLRAMEEAKVEGSFLVVTGNRGRKMTDPGVFDLGLVADNQDLVACADIVVSTAGKSTIDEAAAAGTPIIVIPIRHHAEQERNAASLGYSFESRSRLAELLSEKIGKRETPRVFNGEEVATRLILSLLELDPERPRFGREDRRIGSAA